MKASAFVALVRAFFAVQAVAVSFLHVAAPGAAPAASPAGSPGPAPGPAAPGLPVLDVSFEIMNYNFYDLGKELAKDTPDINMEWGMKKGQNLMTPEQMRHAVVEKVEMAEAKDGSSADVKDVSVGGSETDAKHDMFLEFGKGKTDPMPNCRSDFQNAPACVRDLLEDALVDSFTNMIEEELATAAAPGPASSPGPSPSSGGSPGAAPAVAALLATGVAAPPASSPVAAPAAGPAPAAASSPGPAPNPPPAVHIHVVFQPGREKNLALLQGGIHKDKQSSNLTQPQQGVGRTVIAEVTIVTHTGDGVDEGPVIKAMLDRLEKNGTLAEKIADALFEATGLMAVVGKMAVGTHEMEQWNIDVCEAHLKKVVKMFTMAYTRRMVPMGIYNECTNFMPMVSFSRNAHVTNVDAQRCQKATVQFANGWDYGKNKDFDYREFCVDICELKYGDNAPKCHVTSGKKLLTGGH